MARAETGRDKLFDIDKAFGTLVMATSLILGAEVLLGFDY